MKEQFGAAVAAEMMAPRSGALRQHLHSRHRRPRLLEGGLLPTKAVYRGRRGGIWPEVTRTRGIETSGNSNCGVGAIHGPLRRG